jgi:hypothetical protein
MTKYIGWYSAASDRQFGHCLYKTPDGLTIKITEIISEDKPRPIGRWNDAICMGPVLECVKTLNINWERDINELMDQVQTAIKVEAKCKMQFARTAKCFCHTCKIKTNIN